MLMLCEKCMERTRIGFKGNCILCGGIFDRIDEIANRILEKITEHEFGSFDVGIRLYGSINSMMRFLREKYGIEDDFRDALRKELVKAISSKTGKRRKIGGDISILFNPEDLSFQINVRSVYIYGRYIKRVRNLSQTRWICRNCMGDGCELCNFEGKKYLSVEDLIINPAVQMFRGDNGFLHGAGREDVDARMLGTGRPFILEISKPKKRSIDLSLLEKAVNNYANGRVRVTFISYVDSVSVSKLKNAKFSKIYRAVIRFNEEIDEKSVIKALKDLEGMTIHQRTPKRVEHRRADMVRTRNVYGAKLVMIKNRVAVVEIHAESGLYIKELISGDSGRTKPSLAELVGMDCHVEKLDVVAVLGGLGDGNLKYNLSAFMDQRR